MDEGGRRDQGLNEDYRLPRTDDPDAFALPITFFTQGWVHCLEDTEVAFILMIASRSTTEEVKIQGATRLLHYGIGRDAYEAHIMLNRLSLLEVRPDLRRYDDGKIEGYTGDAHLHSFKLLLDGFETPAFDAVTAAIAEALEQDDD